MAVDELFDRSMQIGVEVERLIVLTVHASGCDRTRAMELLLRAFVAGDLNRKDRTCLL